MNEALVQEADRLCDQLLETQISFRRLARELQATDIPPKIKDELRLLRQLRLDVEHWNESGGETRFLAEIFETLQDLENQFPVGEDDLAYIKGDAAS